MRFCGAGAWLGLRAVCLNNDRLERLYVFSIGFSATCIFDAQQLPGAVADAFGFKRDYALLRECGFVCEYRPNKKRAPEGKPATYRTPTRFMTMSAFGRKFQLARNSVIDGKDGYEPSVA